MTNIKNNHSLGRDGEDFGANFLKKKGHKILARNWRGKYGELDLVSLEDQTLVFTEIKTRASQSFGTPQSAVTTAKQRKLCRAALEFMATGEYANYGVRFDVLALTVVNGKFNYQWFTGAFEFNAGEWF